MDSYIVELFSRPCFVYDGGVLVHIMQWSSCPWKRMHLFLF